MKNKIIILFGLLRYNKEHENRIKMKMLVKYGLKREREIRHYKQNPVQTDLDFGKGCALRDCVCQYCRISHRNHETVRSSQSSVSIHLWRTFTASLTEGRVSLHWSLVYTVLTEPGPFRIGGIADKPIYTVFFGNLWEKTPEIQITCTRITVLSRYCGSVLKAFSYTNTVHFIMICYSVKINNHCELTGVPDEKEPVKQDFSLLFSCTNSVITSF